MHNSIQRLLLHRVNFPCALLLLAALPASGQVFSFGLKAGVPLTTAYSTEGFGNVQAVPYDRPYIVGPTAEIHLPFHLSFEVDALYRRNGFTTYFDGFAFGTPSYIPPSVNRTTINDWQFPFLGKYERKFGPIRPFVDAGVVYRHLSATSTVAPAPPENPNTTGFAIGGGATLNLLLIRLSPEIRYTHWFTQPFNNSGFIVQSTTNQADFLLGISF